LSRDFHEGVLVQVYADMVCGGEIPACKWVRLQCARHLEDLKTGRDRGLWFDVKAATRAIRFCSYLVFWEGAAAGERFYFEPWQAFIVGSLFGWKRADGSRRYRTAWIEVPRKNGKTPLAAAIGLYCLVADGEQGAQVLSVATKRDQAAKIFEHASHMGQRALKDRLRGLDYNAKDIFDRQTASIFRPLAQEANTEDGHNIHAALFDEVHRYKDRKMWDVISSAQISRVNPIRVCITTAGEGDDLTSIAFEFHEFAEQILDGVIENDTWFCYIATLDEGDDWRDERSWQKANPNWDVSVRSSNLRDEFLEAMASPTAENKFRRFYLNEWIFRSEKAIDLDKWRAAKSPIDLEDLKGRPCFGGLDLSAKYDLSAFALRFPPMADNEQWRSLYFSFLPEGQLKTAEDRDKQTYRQWAVDGYLTPTPGDMIDYKQIVRTIEEQNQLFDIRDIGFDSWNAMAIATDLDALGYKMVEMRQGMRTMGGPSKEYDGKIVGGVHNSGINPIADWTASNLMWRKDSNDNFMPCKKMSRRRIDPIVADIMAEGRALVNDEGAPSSYLESAPLLVL
jgi:phage terminase large subunit-like protein